MPYGYLGQNTPNQTVSNSGVFSISDVASLEKQGKFGGSLELIEEQTISSSTSAVDFTSIQENKYDVHFIQTKNTLLSASGTSHLVLYFSNNGGSSFITSGNQYAYQTCSPNGTFGEGKSTSLGFASYLSGNYHSSSNKSSHNAYTYIYNAGNSSKYTFSTTQMVGFDSTNIAGFNWFGGNVYATAETINAFRIGTNDSSTIERLEVKLYGVKQL